MTTFDVRKNLKIATSPEDDGRVINQSPVLFSRGSTTTSAAIRMKRGGLTNASSYFSQTSHAHNISAYKSLIDQMRKGQRPSVAKTDQFVQSSYAKRSIPSKN